MPASGAVLQTRASATHGHEQKREPRGDQNAVAADQPRHPLQVSNPRLLEVNRRLRQRLDAPERRAARTQGRSPPTAPRPAARGVGSSRPARAAPRRCRPGRAARARRRDAPTIRATASSRTARPSRRTHQTTPTSRSASVIGPLSPSSAGVVTRHDSLSERHEVVAGDDGRDRAEHQPIDEQRGRRNDGQARAERLADAAGKAAGDEQRARFDVGRANEDAEEHDAPEPPTARRRRATSRPRRR